MIYTLPSRVRFSEIDEHKNMTLYALINYLQDCATFHGEAAGVGIDHNLAENHAWMIADLQLSVHRYPKFGEEILVSTWSHGFRGMIGYRDFSIETPNGELLAAAASNWVFMDIEKQIPVRVPMDQIEAYGVHQEKKIEEDLGKRKVRIPEEGTDHTTFTIQEYHLDTNRHMNNGQYVRIARKYLPVGMEVHHMRLEFKKQAFLGDAITPRVAEADGKYIITLNDRNGDACFAGEFAQ